MDKNSALQQVMSKMNILGSMIKGMGQQKILSPVINEPMPDVNNKRAMQTAANQRFNPAPKVDTSYATPAWIYQQQLNSLKLRGSKEPNGTWSALSPEGRARVLAPAPVVRDPNHMSGITKDNRITNRLVEQGKLPQSQREIYPQRTQNLLEEFQSFFGGGAPPAKQTLASAPKPDQEEQARLKKRAEYVAQGWLSDSMTPAERKIAMAARAKLGIDGPTPTATPKPKTNYTIPATPGIEKVLTYVTQKMPQGRKLEEYYPALGDPAFIKKITDADKIRPGMASLLLLQSFFESTLGKADNGGNYFGVLPGGEGSGKQASFTTPADAVDYQLGPNVLGGGANPNMNITNENTPLTADRVRQLYDSYNPNSSYIDELLKVMFADQNTSYQNNSPQYASFRR